MQENSQLEAQLFRLYHNEQEVHHLTSELKSKEKEVEQMENKRNVIEDKLKGKRQEHARMSREIASVEKQIRDKVPTIISSMQQLKIRLPVRDFTSRRNQLNAPVCDLRHSQLA